MTRIAINGLGRIGRTFLKLALENPTLEIVAANDISDPDSLAYLIKYDSVYGKYHGSVTVEHVGDEVWLQVGARRLRLFAERHPEALPWKALDVQVVVEASGAFETYAEARRHIDAGAAHVVLTAPAKEEDADDARTVLMGVNPQDWHSREYRQTGPARRIPQRRSLRCCANTLVFRRQFSIPSTAIPRRRRSWTHRFVAEISDEAAQRRLTSYPPQPVRPSPSRARSRRCATDSTAWRFVSRC